jgi:hypothetical protein
MKNLSNLKYLRSLQPPEEPGGFRGVRRLRGVSGCLVKIVRGGANNLWEFLDIKGSLVLQNQGCTRSAYEGN